LRYQSYTAFAELAPDEVTSVTLPKTLATHFKAMTPFVRWLNGALGLSLATRR
jgi:hypothetical protein